MSFLKRIITSIVATIAARYAAKGVYRLFNRRKK